MHWFLERWILERIVYDSISVARVAREFGVGVGAVRYLVNRALPNGILAARRAVAKGDQHVY